MYSGTVVCGTVQVGDELLLGPLERGCFHRVAVSSIHRSRVEVECAQQGQHATLAVQPLDACPAAAAGAAAADREAGEGGSAAPSGEAAAVAQQEAALQPQPLPQVLHTDSADCLHAWMRQACSGAAEGDAARQLPPSTPAVPIEGRAAGEACAGLTASHSAAQLSGSAQLLGSSAELQHAWGSSPQLATAGSLPAPRPRKASTP